MFISDGILGLKPMRVTLPSEVAVHLAVLGEKREMEIGDTYNTFHVINWTEPWGFCTDYDNQGYWDPNSPEFKLPITVEWNLEKVDETGVIFCPHAVGTDLDYTQVQLGNLWLRRMTECLPQIGYTSKSVDLVAKIIKVPQQPWRKEEEPFFCLESELSEILGNHVRDLLKILGLQIPL